MSALKTQKSGGAVPKTKEPYALFRKIDGRHPFKQAVPGGYVDYQVRTRHGGKVTYFNFDLAIEMGLVPADHPRRLTKALQKVILETFALQIINEYDMIHGTKIPPEDVRPHSYMATRYLQLQHPDKRGTTSGDGRSIWNGSVTHRGVTWDVSSCGTGATCLSPATAIEKKFFKTGDEEVCYGCGYADLTGGISAALISEILHRNGVPTERTLGLIEFEKGFSINIRAGKNLLRPSHFFHHLRQANYGLLKAAVDFFIDRQADNGERAYRVGPRERYTVLAEQMATTFAKSAARFESDYLFVWMDWDGDNILATGGIIDYGSVRQFGLFHHEYRYDDYERMSTTIPEQRLKARAMVQTFAQLRDYLLTGTRKRRETFARDKILALFDRTFEEERRRLLLEKIGFDAPTRDELLKRNRTLVERFRTQHAYFERCKVRRGPYKVADGITWDAIYCMRDVLRELPKHLLDKKAPPSLEAMMDMMASSYAKRRDRQITPKKARRMRTYLKFYQDLVAAAAAVSQSDTQRVLLTATMRSSLINRADRVTGNAGLLIAERIYNARKRLSQDDVQKLMETFIKLQQDDPARVASKLKALPLGHALIKLVREYRESI